MAWFCRASMRDSRPTACWSSSTTAWPSRPRASSFSSSASRARMRSRKVASLASSMFTRSSFAFPSLGTYLMDSSSQGKGARMAHSETRLSEWKLAELDPVWGRIREEAQEAVAQEPLLGGVVHSCVLHHQTIEQALAFRISLKLASPEMSEQILREICDEALKSDPEIAVAARADIVAVFDRDPACHRF